MRVTRLCEDRPRPSMPIVQKPDTSRIWTAIRKGAKA